MATIADLNELIKIAQKIENPIVIGAVSGFIVFATCFFFARRFFISEYVTGGKQNYDSLSELYKTLDHSHSEQKSEISELKEELLSCKKEIEILKNNAIPP